MGGCRRGAAGFGTAAAATATAGGCDFDPEEVPDDAWTRITRIDDLDARQAEVAGAKYQQFASQGNGGDWIDILESTGENGLRLADDLDAADVGTMRRLLDSGDMDSADARRMAEMLETKDHDSLLDPTLSADDLLDISERDTLTNVRLVVKDRNGDVRWISRGNDQSGFEHIRGRHVTGSIVERQEASGKNRGAASFFPTGREIEIGDSSKRLPDEMTDEEVENLIYETLSEGTPDSGRGSRVQSTLEPDNHGYDYGIDRVKVIVEPDGSVKTAFPKSGSSVERWSFAASDWV